MLILTFEVGSRSDEQSGEHCSHLRILAEVEEDEVEWSVAIFICHVDINFERTVGLPGPLRKVRLDELAGQFELGLSERHVERQTVLDTVDVCLGLG